LLAADLWWKKSCTADIAGCFYRQQMIQLKHPAFLDNGAFVTIRRCHYGRGHTMRRVIFNQKGGVGKSSITSNLAAISAISGQKTLVLDLDPQCNTTQYLLGEAVNEVEDDIGTFFREVASYKLSGHGLGDFIVETAYENLDIIPSNPSLEDQQAKLEAKHKIYKLNEALEDLDGYDAVYIDTAPAFNFYTLSALIAAQRCLIPFDCDDFSRQALYTLMENIEETQGDHNEDLHIEGIIVNRFQGRAKQPRRIVEELIDEGLPIMRTRISTSVKMHESHDASKPLIHFLPRHKLTQEFVSLYDELMEIKTDTPYAQEIGEAFTQAGQPVA
jgi:chromosome partitioning protein